MSLRNFFFMRKHMKAFVRWYWSQIKRFPRDFALFTIGGIYVAILIEVPKLIILVLQEG